MKAANSSSDCWANDRNHRRAKLSSTPRKLSNCYKAQQQNWPWGSECFILGMTFLSSHRQGSLLCLTCSTRWSQYQKSQKPRLKDSEKWSRSAVPGSFPQHLEQETLCFRRHGDEKTQLPVQFELDIEEKWDFRKWEWKRVECYAWFQMQGTEYSTQDGESIENG